MTDQSLARINELAKKSRTPEGLTDAEKNEQKALRAEYVAAYRNNLAAQLENTYIVDEQGNKRKLEKKK